MAGRPGPSLEREGREICSLMFGFFIFLNMGAILKNIIDAQYLRYNLKSKRHV